MPTNSAVSNQREQQRLATRQRLLAAAIELFAELGFDGAATREIAQRAGLKQSLIVYHFGSKQRLWELAVDEVWARVDSRLEKFMDEKGFDGSREAIELSLRNYLYAVAEHPEYLRILLREMGQPGPRLDWLVEHHTRRHTTRGIDFISYAQRKGMIANVSPVHLAYIIFGAVAVVLAGAPEVERATGYNPLDTSFLDEHAHTLVALLFPAVPSSVPPLTK